MRSAYDAIILGTEKSVLNPGELYIAMRHQRDMLMVSVFCTLVHGETLRGSMLSLVLSCIIYYAYVLLYKMRVWTLTIRNVL